MSPAVLAQQHPVAAMSALCGLLRAGSRDTMQLSILQLHQAIAAQIANVPAAPTAPSPLLMSPSALSALLTPSGSGFHVDFGAALAAMKGEGNADPLDVSLSPLLPVPISAGKRKRKSAATDAERMPAPAAAPNAASSAEGKPASAGRKGGLRMPEGLGGLSVEIANEPTTDGALSASILSNAPLSSILSAFGFGNGPGGFPSASVFSPPSASAFGPSSFLGFPPMSADRSGSQTPLFGLSPTSMSIFVGKSDALLQEALDAPLSTRPLSHSRKSPRLSTGF